MMQCEFSSSFSSSTVGGQIFFQASAIRREDTNRMWVVTVLAAGAKISMLICSKAIFGDRIYPFPSASVLISSTPSQYGWSLGLCQKVCINVSVSPHCHQKVGETAGSILAGLSSVKYHLCRRHRNFSHCAMEWDALFRFRKAAVQLVTVIVAPKSLSHFCIVGSLPPHSLSLGASRSQMYLTFCSQGELPETWKILLFTQMNTGISCSFTSLVTLVYLKNSDGADETLCIDSETTSVDRLYTTEPTVICPISPMG